MVYFVSCQNLPQREAPSVRITFLIGNGFDLNLGLKTRYTDFYPHYCSMPSHRHREIARFRELLKQTGSHPLWADFEKALGECTSVPPLHQQQPLRSCLQDFKRQFAAYLKAEENRIDFDSRGAAMAEKFLSDLGSCLDYVEPHIRNVIQ